MRLDSTPTDCILVRVYQQVMNETNAQTYYDYDSIILGKMISLVATITQTTAHSVTFLYASVANLTNLPVIGSSRSQIGTYIQKAQEHPLSALPHAHTGTKCIK